MSCDHLYELCGLTLRSEIELHLPRATSSDDEVVVRWGEPVGSDDPEVGELVALDEAYGMGWYSVRSTDTEHRLLVRDCAAFVIDGRAGTITVRPVSGGRTGLIPVLLAGTVGALLLTLRGTTVLHASAVALDGVALAFVAQSGRGKSTLAALLCADGAELVTDDVLAVEATAPVRCRGGASEVRLRQAAATALTGGAATSLAARRTADARVAWTPPWFDGGAIELGALVFPFPSRSVSRLEIHRVPPGDALLGLLACPRINGWRRADEITRDFAVLTAVADTVPAYAALIPWGPPFSTAIAMSLSDLAGRTGRA